jgi:hypothetical protein
LQKATLIDVILNRRLVLGSESREAVLGHRAIVAVPPLPGHGRRFEAALDVAQIRRWVELTDHRFGEPAIGGNCQKDCHQQEAGRDQAIPRAPRPPNCRLLDRLRLWQMSQFSKCWHLELRAAGANGLPASLADLDFHRFAAAARE